MQLNIIFLDLDGVLITNWSDQQPIEKRFKQFGKPFNPEGVEVIKHIIDNFDAVIVLTSDWRYIFNQNQLIEYFAYNNVFAKLTPMPYDYRIDFRDKTQYPNYKELRRSKEIQVYVEEYKPNNFVIIDDMDLVCYQNKFVKTNTVTGLNKSDLPKILSILQN